MADGLPRPPKGVKDNAPGKIVTRRPDGDSTRAEPVVSLSEHICTPPLERKRSASELRENWYGKEKMGSEG